MHCWFTCLSSSSSSSFLVLSWGVGRGFPSDQSSDLLAPPAQTWRGGPEPWNPAGGAVPPHTIPMCLLWNPLEPLAPPTPHPHCGLSGPTAWPSFCFFPFQSVGKDLATNSSVMNVPCGNVSY